MELSIGEFARMSGLTPKALRLYDEPGHLATLMVQEGDPDDVGQAIADAVEAAGAPDNYALAIVDVQA